MSEGKEYRIEKDSMGSVSVPRNAYWGAHTARAVENFGVSDKRIPDSLRTALGWIKEAAAVAHGELGSYDEFHCDAVEEASRQVRQGGFADQFPIDLFQTGSGTSWNMNANEVIANRANELLGYDLGTGPVHPNDTVNLGQSSNDVIPSAIRIALRLDGRKLLSSLDYLIDAFEDLSQRSRSVVKLGRTHLQDAVPMTAAQEVAAWVGQLRALRKRLIASFGDLELLPLGGTAVGTGLNSSKGFASIALAHISSGTGIPFLPMDHPFTGIAASDPCLHYADVLNALAVSLTKIAQDIRILSSGPGAGLAELKLRPLQPGSSIMPGKVNPVIPEMVIQAGAFVMGKHLSCTIAAQNSPLQLSIMLPLLAGELLESNSLLSRVCNRFADGCVKTMDYDQGRCEAWIEESLALVTSLAPVIGYDKAAALAKKAQGEGRRIRELALEESGLDEETVARLMDPKRMCGEDFSE